LAYVLIVDDEPDLITLLRDQIGMLGHEVAVARDGVEGLQIALARPPDVVVTDVIMPNMDGPEMLMELRRRPETRDVPVIALTALTDPRTQARMASLGVVGFLAKPYSLRDLAREIDRATARVPEPPSR
jgi:two-component system, OmpR family, phosphate regulon response regulator PhoB